MDYLCSRLIIFCLIFSVVPTGGYENLFARKREHFQTTLQRETFFKNVKNVELSVSLDEFPDLPGWLKFEQKDGFSDGILYGTPDSEAHTIGLAIVGWNKETYETLQKVFMISVVDKAPNITNEIELKIDDDGNDLIRNGPGFLDVVRESWPGALHIISVQKSVHRGIKSEASVFVSVGGNSKYPNDFELLKNLCKGIHNATMSQNIAKKIFESSTYEIDWCSFRDLLKDSSNMEVEKVYFDKSSEYHGISFGMTRWDDSTADLNLDIVYMFVSVFLGLVLIVFLTCIMFFNREGIYQRSQMTSKEQLLHHKILRRTGAQIRNIAGKEGNHNKFSYRKIDGLSRSERLSQSKSGEDIMQHSEF